MIILGIETTGPGGGVAVLRDGETVGRRELARGLMHGRNLVPALGEALAEAGLSPADLDLIAVNRGPGSHTGLRIGLVAAKAMAWSLGKPLAGIGAMDALVAQAPPNDRANRRAVVPAIDARLGRIYGGVRVDDTWVLPPARHDAATLLAAAPDGAMIVGSGAKLLAETPAEPRSKRPALTVAPAECHDIRAATVAHLAAAHPDLAGDPHAIEAIYFT